MTQDSSQQPRDVRENVHKKILIYCPEVEQRNNITTFLEKRGFNNIYIQHAERDVSSWIDLYGIDVVFLFDPERFGVTLDLAQWLRGRHPDCAVVILPGPRNQLLNPHWKWTVLWTLYAPIPTELARQ